MVNSLHRLFTEIIDTLDQAGQELTDPYTRSQVLAVIDILTNLAHRVEWKRAELQIAIQELRTLFTTIAARLGDLDSCPLSLAPLRAELITAVQSALGDDLVAERDHLSQVLVKVMEQIASAREQLPTPVAQDIDQQCNMYLRRQLDRDVALVRRPLFRRMSEA